MSLENLEFELPRRGIVFKPDTEMPDGSLLGFNADPNTASGSGTPGEQLLYNSPSGTRYIQKSVSPHIQWIKTVDAAGGTWAVLTTSAPTPSADVGAFTHPGTVAAGDAVYLTGPGSCDLADADTPKVPTIGLVESVSSPTDCIVRYTGEMSVFAGLTPGSTYYLSKTGVSGTTITTTAPNVPGSGDVVQKVGWAKNTTTLVVQIDRDFTVL